MQVGIVFALLLVPVALPALSLDEEVRALGQKCASASEMECGRLLREFSGTWSTSATASNAVNVLEKGAESPQMMMSLSGIEAAIVWLAGNQNESGSWGTPWFQAFRPTTELRDTSVVLEAFSAGGGKYRDAALAFLTSQNPHSVDYLSRTSRARALAGADMSGAFTTIKADRSTSVTDPTFPNYPNLGWGTNGSAGESNALDTALALHALAGIGIPDPVTSDGVIYLLACQNPDGGFGLQPSRESTLSVTLWGMLALADFSSQPGVPAAIEAAADYVELHQFPSGGIGETSGSITAADTALGELALEAAGRASEAGLAGSALLAMQSSDGSWDQDPYATGLAVVALPEPSGTLQVVSGVTLLSLLVRRVHPIEAMATRAASEPEDVS